MVTKKATAIKALIKEYVSLWDAINVIGCFNTRDLRRLVMVEDELLKAGYEVEEDCRLVIRKRRKENDQD